MKWNVRRNEWKYHNNYLGSDKTVRCGKKRNEMSWTSKSFCSHRIYCFFFFKFDWISRVYKRSMYLLLSFIQNLYILATALKFYNLPHTYKWYWLQKMIFFSLWRKHTVIQTPFDLIIATDFTVIDVAVKTVCRRSNVCFPIAF